MSAERSLSRRALLGGLALFALAPEAGARTRSLVGGSLSLHVPWPVGSADPHRLDDPFAALFGDALFDTLYARDETGALAPSLAEAEPEAQGATCRVRLREGLRSARGAPLDARAAAAAIARARRAGARAWLADIPAPRVEGRSLVFPTRDAPRLVRALASPLVAIVPASFAPESPDGTGPFRFTARGDAATLTRNPNAARGPALLDEVIVREAPDLATSLRAFESGADDIGWIERGLHEPRADSRAFDFGPAGWAALFTGKDAADWDAPGVAQRVCDEVTRSQLAQVGGVGPAWPTAPALGWGGPSTPLLVRQDAPWLVDLARAFAAVITRPGHDVTARPVPASELAQRRAGRAYGLALDLVRPLAEGSLGALVALATADNAGRASELLLHPPKLGDVNPRATTRTLRCGIVCEVRAQGGRANDVLLAPAVGATGFDLGASSRARRK